MPQKAPNEDSQNKIAHGHIIIVREARGSNVGVSGSRAYRNTGKSSSLPNLHYSNNQPKEINEFSLVLDTPVSLNKVLLNMELFPNFNKISLPIKDKIKIILKRHVGSRQLVEKIIIKSNVTNLGFKVRGHTFSNRGELLVNINSTMLIDNDNNIYLLPNAKREISSGTISKNIFGSSIGKDNTTAFFRGNRSKIPSLDLYGKVPLQKDIKENVDSIKLLRRHKEKIEEHRLISFRDMSEEARNELEIDSEEIETVPTSLELHKQRNFKISQNLAANIKKYLIDDSQLKKQSIEEINILYQRTFFISLGFYQSLIVRNGIKKYYVYEDNEFNFYIDMLISKKIPIKVNYRKELYKELYRELFDFLENGNIPIGKFGKLILEAQSIVIEVNKELKSITEMTPVKSKKLRFKKNEK